MLIHYENLQAALDHFADNGWTQLRNGWWVSNDRTCRAAMTAQGGRVAIYYAQIDRVAA